MDWVQLSKFTIPCVIGLLESEQRKTQSLRVEIRMGTNLDAAAAGDLTKSIDYVTTMGEVMFLAQQGKWRLLESLAAAIARWILLPPEPSEQRARVARVRLWLEKPEILGGVAVPGILVERSSDWCVPEQRDLGPGLKLDVLQETATTGAYRIRLSSGARYTAPSGMMLHPVAGTVQSKGQIVPLGRAMPLSGSEIVVNGQDGGVVLAVSQPPIVFE